MKNLAGSKDADTELRYELSRAIIDVIPIDRSKYEVRASVGGKLGRWIFTRNWYYWVAAAPKGEGIPIEVARELYADPVGKSDIRVGGHCGCPPPDEYGATYLDAEGRLLIAERERADFEHFFATGVLDPNVLEGSAFTADPKTDHHHATIDLYHIDSELGLRLFANVLRGLQKGPA